MTVLAKITLAAALLLSIAVPFGAFAAGEKTKGRYKTAIGANVFLFIATIGVAAGLMFTGHAFAAEETAKAVNSAAGWGYLAAALSTGMSCLGGFDRPVIISGHLFRDFVLVLLTRILPVIIGIIHHDLFRPHLIVALAFQGIPCRLILPRHRHTAVYLLQGRRSDQRRNCSPHNHPSFLS